MPDVEGLQRNQWGWGLIDVNGELVGYPRISSVSQGLKDNFMLVNWQKRNTAVGVAHNVALANRIRALDPETEKKGLDLLVKEAEHFSGANNAAEKGTYIHLLTESVDAGENVVIPPEYLPIVSAYKNTVQGFGLKQVSAEGFVVVDELQVCGSYDRIWEVPEQFRPPDGPFAIGDLKTGKSAPSYSHSIAIQMAMYAHGVHYNPLTRQRTPLPDGVSKMHGLLIHAPLTGGCDIYTLDLVEAWYWAQEIVKSRAWQKAKLTTKWSK